MEQLTKDWSEGWREKQVLLEQYGLDVNRHQAGLLMPTALPQYCPRSGERGGAAVRGRSLRLGGRSLSG